MSHISTMSMKWKKLAFFILLNEILSSSPNNKYTYIGQICGTSNDIRSVMYFHLETDHSSERILEYFLDLPFRVAKEDFIRFFCGETETDNAKIS